MKFFKVAVPAIAALFSASALAQGAADLGASPAPAGMMAGIFQKLSYDKEYFESVLALKSAGRTDARMSKEDFDKEVKRAQANVPVLRKLFEEKPAYDKDSKHLSLPPRSEQHRVYSNLITLLNQLKSFDAKDWKGVLAAGERVVITDKKDLGVVQNEDARYYLSLYREYFWLMAAAHYRLGNDKESVMWLAKVDQDVSVQQLKKQISENSASSSQKVEERLARLYGKSVGILPFKNLAPHEETNWMSSGFAEVFTSDLVTKTNLVVIERANIEKVLKEVGLSQVGVTDEKNMKKAGDLLTAGTLIRGQYKHNGATVDLALDLCDGADGRVLVSKTGVLKPDSLFADGRELLLELLHGAGWISNDVADDIRAVRAPTANSIRDLLNARLLLASKSDEARELYKRAMKESPEYANQMEELKKSFEGVNPTVAVMNFVNTSGSTNDTWMSQGVTEALHSDLPNIGFTLVERSQLATVLSHQAVGQLVDEQYSRDMAKKLGADFLVLGSVMHRTPTVRVDARFVDVTTGTVLQAFDMSGRDTEFPSVIARLSSEIARKFNIKLSAEQLAKLTGSKMNSAEFERFAREQLQKENLTRQQVKEEQKQANRTVNKPFWAGVGGIALGAAAGTTGFLLAGQQRDAGAYADALLSSATRQDDIDRLGGTRDAAYGNANTWTMVGVAGIAVAGASLGYLVYQELTDEPQAEGTLTPIVATDGKTSATIGLTTRF